MKLTTYIIVFIVSILVFGCEVDRETNLIVSTEDYTIQVLDNAVNDFIVTELRGTSNQGAVNFEILSQTPSEIFTISDPNYGVLIVNNDALLEDTVTPQVVLEVLVSKENITKTSTVTINILDSGCQDVSPDILQFFDVTNYNAVLGVFSPTNLGDDYLSTMDISCGRLNVQGENLLCAFCAENPDSIDIQFFPSADGTTGEVKLFPEAFRYNNFIEVVGSSGTYDTATKIITIDVDLVDDFGPFTNRLILTAL